MPDLVAALPSALEAAPPQEGAQPYDASTDPALAAVPGVPTASDSLNQFDQKVQYIDAIHNSWSLPKLPGEVTMDLASIPGVSPQDLGHFLTGIEGDLNRVLQPATVPFEQLAAQQQTGVSQDPYSFGNQLKAGIAGLEGAKPPTVVDPSSAAYVRKQAIRYGLIPANTPLDAPWTAADNALLHGVSQAQLQDRISGNEPLSVSTSKLGKASVLDPATVLGAVGHAVLHAIIPTQHDLNVAKTAQDNLLSHFSLGNLWKTVKAYVPVATPIATDVLMLTGVGEVIGTTRAALAGADAMPALYSASDGLLSGLWNRSVDTGAEAFGRAQEQGLASRLLGRVPGTLAQRAAGGAAIGGAIGAGGAVVTGNPDQAVKAGLYGAGAGATLGAAAPAASDAMAAWRGLKPVAAAKAALSPVFRLGAVETGAAVLAPDSSIGQGVRQNRDLINAKVMSNPILNPASQVLSMAFAPPNVFRPGTFSGPLTAASGLVKAMGMVGADYNDTRATAEFARGLLSDGVKANAENLNQALLDAHGGDVESVGHAVTWAQHMAAIDTDAMAMAKRAAGPNADVATLKNLFLRARSLSVGRLAHINPGDEDQFLTILNAKANGLTTGSAMNADAQVAEAQAVRSQFKAALGSEDPAVRRQALDEMNAYIDSHNRARSEFSNQLLNSLQPGMVERWTKDYFNANGNWHDFVAASDDLRQADLGSMALNTAVGDPARGWGVHNEFSQKIAEAALYRATNPDLTARAGVNPLTRDFVPAPSKITVARLDTPTTNDITRIINSFKLADKLEQNLKYMADNPDAQRILAGVFSGMNPAEGQQINSSLLGRAVSTAAGDQVTDRLRQAAQTINQLHASPDIIFSATDQAGGAFRNLDSATAQLRAARQQLENAVPWSDQWGIDASQDLATKLKTLRRLMNFTAQDVNVDPELASSLASRGYKAVYGAVFAHPDDVREFVHPFNELTGRQLWRMSLGTFINPAGNDVLGRVVHQNLRNGLTDAFTDRGLVTPEAVADPNNIGVVDDVIDHLHSFVQSRQDAATAAKAAAKPDNLANRALTNLANSFTPQGIRSLSMNQITDAVKGTAIEGNTGAINDVYQAIKDAHVVGFQYRGLANFEDKARGWNILMDGLMLGQTSSGAEIRRILSGAGRAAGVGAAFGVAGGIANQIDSGQFSPAQLVGNAVGGAETGLKFEAIREGLGAAGRRVLPGFDDSQFVRYGYLPEGLAKLRDHFRFTLSPFFDARRFTKGAVIAQMKADHAGVDLPFINSLGSLARTDGADAVEEAKAMWNAASRGDYTNLDDTERFFSQRGLLGYSPKDWMAATNYRLVKGGMDPEQAAKLTKEIYSYGVNGRSGLEQSANFMFFPFSFGKKLVQASGQFFADDFSRTLAVHDGLKTYDLLNQQYDLTKELQDHVPLAADLEKLNAFYHGVNMGELGGANAPLLHFFTPIALHLASPADHHSVQNLAQRLLPAYNDITRLRDDLAQQGHVMFGSTHLTSQAETDAGFQAQKQLKDYVGMQLDKLGYRMSQLTNAKPGSDLAPMKEWYDTQKAQILQIYPAYGVELAKLASQRTVNDEALQQILNLPQPDPGSQAFADFHGWLQRQQQILQGNGYDIVNHPEDIPSDVAQKIRMGAVRFYDNAAFSGGGDRFKKLYKTYAERQWGPIERTL